MEKPVDFEHTDTYGDFSALRLYRMSDESTLELHVMCGNSLVVYDASSARRLRDWLTQAIEFMEGER